ncbi:MAG: hypothetical protein AAF939_17705, partial [Planctomycetota bacterium]
MRVTTSVAQASFVLGLSFLLVGCASMTTWTGAVLTQEGVDSALPQEASSARIIFNDAQSEQTSSTNAAPSLRPQVTSAASPSPVIPLSPVEEVEVGMGVLQARPAEILSPEIQSSKQPARDPESARPVQSATARMLAPVLETPQ